VSTCRYPAEEQAAASAGLGEQYEFAELTQHLNEAEPDQPLASAPVPHTARVVRPSAPVGPVSADGVAHEALVSPAGLYAGISVIERARCGVSPALLDAVSLDLLIDDLPGLLREIRALRECVSDGRGPQGNQGECSAEGAAGSSQSQTVSGPGTETKAIHVETGGGVPT
jgi:hypothetical protein